MVTVLGSVELTTVVAPNRNNNTGNNKKRNKEKKENFSHLRPNELKRINEKPFRFVDDFLELKSYQEKRGMIAKDGSWAIAVGPKYTKSGIYSDMI